MPRPLLPIADADSEPFWQACEESRLVGPVCTDCGAWSWPPSPCCRRCRSQAQEWRELSGFGVIWSFARVHHAFHPSLAKRVPYIVGLIDLDEGLRMVGRVEAGDKEPTIGARVRARFEEQEGRRFPYFELAPGRREEP